MKYDHVVKVDGVFYEAGQEVPNGKGNVEQKHAPAHDEHKTMPKHNKKDE